MPGYVYRGNRPLGAEPPLIHRGRITSPCGTEGAFQRHKRHNEEIDPECLAAHKAYKKEENDARSKRRAQRREARRANA